MSPDRPELNLKSIRLIGLMILVSCLAYPVIGIAGMKFGLIPRGGVAEMSGDTKYQVGWAICALGMMMAAGSIVVRKQLDSRAPSGPEGNVLRYKNVLLAMAIAEAPGVLGFVAAFVLGELMIPTVLWGVAIAGCLMHFPTRGSLGIEG